MKKLLTLTLLLIAVLLGIFYLGYWIRPRLDPCQQPEADTIYMIDTVVREIPNYVPYYITRTDSVILRDTVFHNVDTTEILRRYYAMHYYTREFSDSMLYVQMHDAVSMNEIVDTKFNYRINRPMQIIINQVAGETIYKSYLYLGTSYPNFGIEAMYAGPRLLVGAGWAHRLNSSNTDFDKYFTVHFALPLIRFK